ncbi:MAG: glycosyl hydrolase-related protein [Bacteroidales bacterium]|nr:glycosyl hydrolase-related protein [Bacteroidales bacterium]
MIRSYKRLFLTFTWSLLILITQNANITAQQSKDADIYLVPFSHLDFFWGGTREECVSRGNRIIARVIQMANESPKFRFLHEDNVFVANFMDSHKGLTEVEELKRLVKEGKIEIAPKWVGIFQELPDGEVHARNMAIGKRYAKDVFGVDAKVAHLGDLPGYTSQFPQILKQSRVPYTVITRMGPYDKSVFNWTSPDGSKVLAWNALNGYGWGTFLTSENTSIAEKKERFFKDLAVVQKTTNGPIMMHWGTDLWAPPIDLVNRMEEFFKQVPAHLTISTPTDFFRQLEKDLSVPDVSGEIPSSWPNIVSSLVHIWPKIIPATNTLLAAEKFATINYMLGYADYPQQEFEFLWKKLVESMDHNHDGQGGTIGDNRKIEYEQLSVIHGGEILRDMLRNIAERIEIPIAHSFPIVVFNPMGWNRNDIVHAHLTLFGDVWPYDIDNFRKGMRLLNESGNPVPFYVEEWSENISRALQLVFVARDVPSIGYKTYYLVPSEKPDEFPETSTIKLDSDNDRKEPRRALGSDVIENRFYRLSVDRTTGRVTLFDKEINRVVCPDMEVVALEERGGNYIGKEPPSGRTFINMVNEVSVLENNAVQTVIQIKGCVADIPVTQHLTLYHDLKQVDIENTVEWNTQIPRFVRIRQVFPIAWDNAKIHYGIPFGANSADNLMPGAETKRDDEITNESWKNSRLIHDWIHAGTEDEGLTIATDHQQIRLGDDVIYAEMVRGTRYVSVKVKHGDELTSRNYPPAGTYIFHYSLSSGPGSWKVGKSYRSGMNLTNPLLPVSVADEISTKSLPPIHSFCSVQQDNIVISSLKKADLNSSVVLRMYEIEGSDVRTSVKFLDNQISFKEVNLLEEDIDRTIKQTLQVSPYAIKTIKFNLKNIPR